MPLRSVTRVRENQAFSELVLERMEAPAATDMEVRASREPQMEVPASILEPKPAYKSVQIPQPCETTVARDAWHAGCERWDHEPTRLS